MQRLNAAQHKYVATRLKEMLNRGLAIQEAVSDGRLIPDEIDSLMDTWQDILCDLSKYRRRLQELADRDFPDDPIDYYAADYLDNAPFTGDDAGADYVLTLERLRWNWWEPMHLAVPPTATTDRCSRARWLVRTSIALLAKLGGLVSIALPR